MYTISDIGIIHSNLFRGTTVKALCTNSTLVNVVLKGMATLLKFCWLPSILLFIVLRSIGSWVFTNCLGFLRQSIKIYRNNSPGILKLYLMHKTVLIHYISLSYRNILLTCPMDKFEVMGGNSRRRCVDLGNLTLGSMLTADTLLSS